MRIGRHSHTPRLLAACTVTAAVVALTACDSSGSGTPSSSSPPSSPAPSSTVTSATPSSTSSSVAPTVTATHAAAPSSYASSAPAKGKGECTNAQLRTRSGRLPGGDSHGGIVVIFMNTSSMACSLYGYPGAAAVDRSGKQFEQAARTTKGSLAGSRLARISLAPGASASSVIEGDNAGGDECLRGHTVLVTPPNTTRAVTLAYLDAYACHFQVHPVVAGTRGGST